MLKLLVAVVFSVVVTTTAFSQTSKRSQFYSEWDGVGEVSFIRNSEGSVFTGCSLGFTGFSRHRSDGGDSLFRVTGAIASFAKGWDQFNIGYSLGTKRVEIKPDLTPEFFEFRPVASEMKVGKNSLEKWRIKGNACKANDEQCAIYADAKLELLSTTLGNLSQGIEFYMKWAEPNRAAILTLSNYKNWREASISFLRCSIDELIPDLKAKWQKQSGQGG